MKGVSSRVIIEMKFAKSSFSDTEALDAPEGKRLPTASAACVDAPEAP
jgi:hypothetical protein